MRQWLLQLPGCRETSGSSATQNSTRLDIRSTSASARVFTPPRTGGANSMLSTVTTERSAMLAAQAASAARAPPCFVAAGCDTAGTASTALDASSSLSQADRCRGRSWPGMPEHAALDQHMLQERVSSGHLPAARSASGFCHASEGAFHLRRRHRHALRRHRTGAPRHRRAAQQRLCSSSALARQCSVHARLCSVQRLESAVPQEG